MIHIKKLNNMSVNKMNGLINLPDLNYSHRWNLVVKMIDDNNILMVNGDFYKYNNMSNNDNINGYGCCEWIDLRQKNKKWNIIDKYISHMHWILQNMSIKTVFCV